MPLETCRSSRAAQVVPLKSCRSSRAAQGREYVERPFDVTCRRDLSASSSRAAQGREYVERLIAHSIEQQAMPVFERPYLKRDSTVHCGEPIFGIYTFEPLGIGNEFGKSLILDRELLRE